MYPAQPAPALPVVPHGGARIPGAAGHPNPPDAEIRDAMPEPTRDFPFAYRLPTDMAAGIQGPTRLDIPLVDIGSPRRRLAVLVLVLGLLGSGFAAGLPSATTQTLRGEDCRPGWVVDAFGDVTRDGTVLC